MDIKERVNQVLVSFGLKAEDIQVVKLAQMTLMDGVTILEADAFEAGKDVFIVTENGNVKAPVGEYELEDGNVLIVEVEGVIGEVKEAQAEEAMPETVHPNAEATEPPMEMEQEKPKKTVESTVKETYFAEIEALKAENEALKAQVVELSSTEPAVKPIVHNPENTNKQPIPSNLSGADLILSKIYQ